ncbi:MAG: glycosyltransferase [Ruminococcus sp.]|nr:glycosyltransferase [Ruminococcus sp.]
MKVCMVCDVLGEENNGTTVAAMNLIRSLRAKGHKVTVVCPDQNRKGMEGYVIVDKLNLGPLNGYLAKNGVTLSRASGKLLEPVVQDADVVHLLVPFALANAALRIARKYHKPVTASFHAQAENITSHFFMKDFEPANKIAYLQMYYATYRHVDAVHYPTEFIRDVFENAVGHKTNAYVISNGVGERFRPNGAKKPSEFKNKFVILFSGRYSKEKSHTVLIDAAALSRHESEIQLIFAGDGPLKDKLKLYSKKLTNRPVFAFFPHKQMLNVLNYADLYVHPAEIEIEAIACLEAIACGQVPIISDSERSATKKFALDENNLFKANDPQSLAEKIDFFIENPAVLEEYRERYQGMAEEYSQKTSMDRMEQMLFDVIEKKRSHG